MIKERHKQSVKIYLFGSRARGTNTPGADIDLAVDCGKKLEIGVRSKIQDLLRDVNVPFFVDIVDMNTADENILSEIKKDGVVWKS